MRREPNPVVCLLGSEANLPPDVQRRIAGRLEGVEVHRVPFELTPAQRAARVGGPGGAGATPEDEIDAVHHPLLARCVGIMAVDVPLTLGSLAPQLRLVQGASAGIEWFLPARLHEHGVRLCNARGLASPSIAEFVLARLLQVWKLLPEFDDQQRAHRWEPRYAANVAGRTIGLVGLGGIGRAVATRARAFGVHVLATRNSLGGDAPVGGDADAELVWPAHRLDDMLPRCDAVVCSVPATATNADLFDAGRFAAMRPGAVFVNVARGSLVDEGALLDALRSGHLGAAVLDVTKVEPTPADHPFWDAERLFLSPHSSMSFDGYVDAVADLFVDNVRRVLDGRALRNEVDPALGY